MWCREGPDQGWTELEEHLWSSDPEVSVIHPACGRACLAPGLLRDRLASVVEQGVAFDFEESAVGIACVAAPILDAADRALAAISVTVPVHRFLPARHAAQVRATAAGVAATLARRASLRD